MHASRTLALLLLSVTLLTASPASSDTPALALQRALADLPDGGSRFLKRVSRSPAPALLVPVKSRAAARAANLIPITDTLAVGARAPDTWEDLLSSEGIVGVSLASHRYPLLDKVAKTVRLEAAQNDSGLRGEGTIIGVVDTGGDASHPALLDDTGRSRVAWFLAFGQEPLGLHPELEEEYGCYGDEPCSVLSGEDIDEIIASRILARLPKDPVGHGTHITSLAAGRDPEYPGIAPAADLILVAASEVDGGVSDARILLGTKFVFDRATELGRPAVVNISLGSGFGAHDGTSWVEKGLAQLGQGEGRAIVIASGNSGEVVTGLSRDYPEPLGFHTEVAVLPTSEVRVPILTSITQEGTLEQAFFVWISTRPSDRLSVGFGNGDKSDTSLVIEGTSSGMHSKAFGDDDDYDVIILNGVDDGLDQDVLPGSVVVAVIGSWKAGRVFELILKGNANARMWATGIGTAGPLSTRRGPMFPRARTRGTVAVPGSQPDIITVGSTVNRYQWTDYSGGVVAYAPSDETRSPFSGVGPNQNGALKPELVAPGGGVIGAMAREADPRTSLIQTSQFGSYGACPDEIECFVIDDEHGIASGTSMSAPLVAGAAALLMQRDPSITMQQVKRYLMAGSHAVDGQQPGSLVGVGELDIVGALLAQERDLEEAPGDIDGAQSRLVWAQEFAYPAPGPALEGYLLARDSDGEPVSVASEELIVTVEGPGQASWQQLAPGLIFVQLTADAGSAGESLVVSAQVGAEQIGPQIIPIERDPALAEHGYELAGGTCSLDPKLPRHPRLPLLLLTASLLGLYLARRRERRSQ